MKILISGAGIAGSAVAFWLTRAGHDVTVVDLSPTLRTGGQAVDFKGPTHRMVLDRMGLWEDIYELRTSAVDQHLVDADGRTRATIPHEFTGGDIEILRGDLGTLLFNCSAEAARWIFDDRIEALTPQTDHMGVRFRSGRCDSFDLVIGADGIHSGVRRLAFGPEHEHVQHLGYHYAVVGSGSLDHLRDSTGTDGWDTNGPGRRRGYWYNEPGRLATIGGPKAPDLYVFSGAPEAYERNDSDSQKQYISERYNGMGWRVPEMLARLEDAPDFYIDGINRVRMDRFYRNRVVLVGDSAYGNTLGGFGTGLAVVGAYVLAGELLTPGAGVMRALGNYDSIMRRYAKIARSGNAGPFLAPPSKLGIRLRDLSFSNRVLFKSMMKITDIFATNIQLPEYNSLTHA